MDFREASSNPGTVYYVDGSAGNDYDNCLSEATACKTIQAAVYRITAGAGDEVLIRGKDGDGNQIVYAETVFNYGMDISGTTGNPTIFKPWLDNEPPLLGTSDEGGVAAPSVDEWIDVNNADPPGGRIDHTAIWTGSQMVVWGGSAENTGGIWTPNNGDTCTNAGGCWISTAIIAAPDARYRHTAVWTGSKMVVWGGSDWANDFSTGGIWTPGGEIMYSGDACQDPGGCWESVNNTGAPRARYDHTAIWDGGHMVVWGGFGEIFPGVFDELSTGGIWTPKGEIMYSGSECLETGGCWENTNQSGSQKPEKRTRHAAIWTGSHMLISGGLCGDNDCLCQNYPPSSPYLCNFPDDASWTPRGKIMYSGETCGDIGGCWEFLAMRPAGYWPERHTAVWTGDHMVTWGGVAWRPDFSPYARSAGVIWAPKGGDMYSGLTCQDTGGCWEIVTLDLVLPKNDPDAMFDHTAVWTGSHMIIWGGIRSDGVLVNTGSIWTPRGGIMYSGDMCPGGPWDTGGCWEKTNTIGAPSPRSRHTAIFISGCPSAKMVVFGGGGEGAGGIYGVIGVQGSSWPFPVFNIIDPPVDVHDIVFENLFVGNADLVSINGGSSKNIGAITIRKNTIMSACSMAINFSAPNITSNVITNNVINASPDEAIYFNASASIASNTIDSNTIRNGNADAIHFLAGASPITSNTIRGNTIYGNQGDAIELLSSASINSNIIKGNILARNLSYGLWFNGSASATLSSNKIFNNTADTNTFGNIRIDGKGAGFSGNKIRNTISSNTPGIQAIKTNFTLFSQLDSNYNFFYNTSPPKTLSLDGEVNSLGPSGVTDPFISTYPAFTSSYYLKSKTIASQTDLGDTPLANGIYMDYGSFIQAKDYKRNTPLAIGSRAILANTIGARKGLVINQNGSANCSDGLCVLSNSLQQAHDHESISFGDHLNVYTVYSNYFPPPEPPEPDRIYDESLGAGPEAPITFTKRGIPGYSIIWHNLSYEYPAGNWHVDDAPNFLVRVNAGSSFDFNIEAKLDTAINRDKFRCVDMNGFLFDKDPAITGDTTGELPMGGSGGTHNYHWDCTPYRKTVLESQIFDTGYESGVSYNTITWFGVPAAGERRSVQLQLATSNSKSGPWEYSGPVWCGDPLGDEDTYIAYPGEPVGIKCYNKHYNHRYFRYKIMMFCEPIEFCPQDGDSAPRVDEVRVNYSQ